MSCSTRPTASAGVPARPRRASRRSRDRTRTSSSTTTSTTSTSTSTTSTTSTTTTTTIPPTTTTTIPATLPTWSHLLGGAGFDLGYGVAVDSSRNVYVTGYVSSGVAGETLLGDKDAFIAKYSPTGSRLWVRQFGSSVGDSGTSIAVDSAGNVYVAGYTSGVIAPGESVVGAQDAMIAKYSSSGTKLWAHQFGSTLDDSASSVAVDSAGNVYVGGFAKAQISGATGYRSGQDGFVAKYSSSGTAGWVQHIGSTGNDNLNGVATDSAGNVYAVGNAPGAVTSATGYVGGTDAFIAKLTSAGVLSWAKMAGAAGTGTDNFNGVATDSAGNVYAVGYSNAAITGSSGYVAGQDVTVVKYTSAGDATWARHFGSAAADTGSGIVVSGSTVYVAGSALGAVADASPAYVGDRDGLVASFSTAGVAGAVHHFATGAGGNATAKAAPEALSGIAVDSNGNVFVSGYTAGSLPGESNQGPATNPLTNYDVVVARFP